MEMLQMRTDYLFLNTTRCCASLIKNNRSESCSLFFYRLMYDSFLFINIVYEGRDFCSLIE